MARGRKRSRRSRPARGAGGRPLRPREGAGWEPTWLQGGRIPVAAVQDLFEAARALYAIAPWKSVYDGQVIRMDIPDLDVDGACVSIIGQLGESTGILIFPTPMDYASFRDAAERHVEGRRREAFKAGLLALNYERAEDLPPGMRREMDEHGWPVVGLHACPEVQRMEPVPILHPLTERDLRIVTACARSLVGFFLKSGQTFEADDPEPVCVSFFDENDFEVRFTVPYGARHQFDLEHGEDGDAEDEEPGAATAAFGSVAPVGRNDPCPCGSGRKYKHCHMHLDKQAEAAGAIRHRLHDLDNDLVERIALFAMRRFGSAFDEVLLGFMDQSEHEQLGRIWAVYGHSLEGRSAAEWFLEEKAGMLGRRERDWIKAQMNAWLSIWEVTDVDYGVSVTIRDLLSGQIRTVPETSASRTLVLRDTVLGRVVDSDAVSLLCGVHHRPLPPVEADSVAERVRRRLRRKGLVPIERLRDPDFGGYLIRAWRKAVRELDRRASVRPVLHNMDGDLLRLTRDMFSVRPESRRSIESALSEWPDVDAHTTEEGAREFMINRAPRSKASKVDTVVVGRAFFEEGVLHIETNSVERADTLRARFENAFAGEIGHLQRQHVDLFAGREAGGGRSAASPRFLEPSSPELDALTLQHKERHYADWIDHPLPALNGESPRAAAQSEAGRRAVELLLKGMENREQRRPEGTRFDFSEIRRKLGLG